MTQYGFAFIGHRCSGCKTCMLACKDYNDLDETINFRKLFEFGGGSCRIKDGVVEDTSFVYYVSSACNHCTKPVCVHVCPTGAMTKDSNTGIVYVDDTRCVGCGYCEMSCPYGAPKVNREKGHSVKCNGCIDRVSAGKKPICVESCTMRALEFDDIGVLRAKYGDVAAIAPLPDAKFTEPNLVIVEPAHALPPDSTGGCILNIKEVM